MRRVDFLKLPGFSGALLIALPGYRRHQMLPVGKAPVRWVCRKLTIYEVTVNGNTLSVS